MRIIEDNEVLEYCVDETVFFYRRLRLAEVQRLGEQYSERGTMTVNEYNVATLKLGLLGWSNLQGLGGREVVSPPVTDRSAEAQRQREYVVDCLPYEVLMPFAEALRQPTVGAIEKNSPPPSNGSSASPIPGPDTVTAASIADASAATAGNVPHATAEGSLPVST